MEGLGAGRSGARDARAGGGRGRPLRGSRRIHTSKPVLYVANVEEGVEEVPAAVAAHAEGAGASAVAISARIEVELSEN